LIDATLVGFILVTSFTLGLDATPKVANWNITMVMFHKTYRRMS
jgi:hypothetical protein